MKKFAKILSALLCLAMVLSFASVAFAAEESKTYVKVTADQEDWSGTYLLVCEETGYAFNSGLEKLDAAMNSVAVTAVEGKITTAENIAITIEKVEGGYVMKAANGQYFFGKSGSNKLLTTTDQAEAAVAAVTFAFNEGELAIVSDTSHMRFNPTPDQSRFRFFKESSYTNQKAVALYKLDEAAEPAAEEVTIPQAIEIAKEGNGKKYIVRGTVKEVKNDTWGNLYIQDADGNELYVYGLYSADGSTRYDAMEVKPVAGDQVVLLGELSTYNDAPQMKNAWLQAHTPAEKEEEPAPTPDPVAVTIPEANTIGAGMEHNTYTEGKYIVTGTICEITNTQYGNLYIQDAEGNKLFVYGLYNAEGTRFDKLDPQPKVGDVVTLEGVLGQYNGNPQMKNATMTAHTVTDTEEPTPDPIPDPVEITIPEAVAIGAAKEHNTFTEEKYIVTGVIVEITSDKYGNVYIQDTEGNKLFVYGMYDADGNRYDAMATKPAVGDTVTLVGVLGQYNGNAQMKNATVTAHTPAAPVEPPVEEPSTGTTTEHTFNSLTDVNTGSTEDKAEIPEGTTFADGFFTVIGKLTQRYQESKGGIYAVEIAKNGQGALQFTTQGTANVTFVVSSTGKENTSAVALINVATGEIVANVEGLSEISTTTTTTLTYKDLPAGTYQLVSPQSDYNRGFRLMTARVEQTVTGPAQTGDAIMMAVCSLLVSGSVLAVLPKKREF